VYVRGGNLSKGALPLKLFGSGKKYSITKKRNPSYLLFTITLVIRDRGGSRNCHFLSPLWEEVTPQIGKRKKGKSY